MSLLNIMMDLKKCCNHPYLFPVAAVVRSSCTPLSFHQKHTHDLPFRKLLSFPTARTTETCW